MTRSGGMLPTLTICVPTHHGRARTIRDTLTSVAEQLRPEHAGRVTVVVSDNDSQDGTEDVIAEFAAAGLPVSYRRNVPNVGYASNLDRVVEQATGEWCWLLSSDDRLRDGAIDRALELLAAHPDVGGMTVNQLVMDHELRDATWQQTTPAVPPELDEVTVLHGADRVVGAVGWMMAGLSTLVVRRRDWIEAGAPLRARADHGLAWYPHVAIPLRIVTEGRRWLWCPEKLVDARAGNVEASLARRPRLQGELLMHLDATWDAAVGPDSPGRRTARRRYLHGVRALSVFAEIRADRRRTRQDSAWLLLTFGRILGRDLSFWRHDAWRLVVPARVSRPGWLQRLRRAAAPSPPPVPSPPPARSTPRSPASPDPRITLVADLARRARPADMLAIPCRVAVPPSTGVAAPVVLRSRWTSTDGERVEGPPLVLSRPPRPGAGRTIAYPLNAPVALGEWELRIAVRPTGDWEDGEDDAVGTVTVRP